jgi:hypothetical protein
LVDVVITTRRRLAVAALALAVTLPAAACTSGGSQDKPSDDGTSTVVATRWWSNDAAAAGSTIDPKKPKAKAAKLHASQSEYCGMLEQTLAAGKSILPGVSASDPALLTATEAFISEVQQVAPADVAGQWRVVGDAVVQFVKSGGKSLGTDSRAVSKAVQDISLDARTSCHVDLSAVPTK